MIDEETSLVRSFVARSKQERLVALLKSKKGRPKAIRTLAHFGHLDSRFTIPIPAGDHDAESILDALRRRGAGKTCYVVSECAAIDGKTLPLLAALQNIVGQGYGTLLSCSPGQLAYYEGEEAGDRCILDRRRKPD